MLALLFDFINTSPTLLHVLALVVLVHARKVDASSYAEFPADGGTYPNGLLRTAVGAYCASPNPNSFTFSDGGNDYGPIEDWRTGLVTNMALLFAGKSTCNPNISGWDTSSVENMNAMFQQASSFNGDLSGRNVTKVTRMYAMFEWASSFNGGDLSGWDTASVRDMSYMFYRRLRSSTVIYRHGTRRL